MTFLILEHYILEMEIWQERMVKLPVGLLLLNPLPIVP